LRINPGSAAPGSHDRLVPLASPRGTPARGRAALWRGSWLGRSNDQTIEETVRALDDVVRAGKARYVGFSNLPAWVASKALTFAGQNGLARFQSAQVYYSIAGRDIEREIAPMCRAEQVAILPWSPLAGGLLSGKFDPDKKGPADARRASFDFPPVDMARLPRVLAALRSVADATGASVARVALAWQLTKPFVTSIIIGAKRKEQLVDNIAATELKLGPEHVKTLDDASALPPEYPGWMVDFQNSRDPRGVARTPTEAEIRAAADRLK